jgi:hypothetical protein
MSCKWNLCTASLALLLAAPLMFPAVASSPQALPHPVAAALPDARLVGLGSLRWLGLHIYDAALWAEQAVWTTHAPFALDIRYARRIPGTRLAATSVEEMRRMALGDAEELRRWRREMERIFPDVSPGDRVIGVNLPGRGVAFYSAERLLGRIEDDAFARAFFAIWLDPRTREPGLRASLLGDGGPTR